MSTHILSDKDGQSCLYCSTTEWAFGPIFHTGEDAEDFLKWLGTDPRHLTDGELEDKVAEWRQDTEDNEGMATRGEFIEPMDYRQDR